MTQNSPCCPEYTRVYIFGIVGLAKQSLGPSTGLVQQRADREPTVSGKYQRGQKDQANTHTAPINSRAQGSAVVAARPQSHVRYPEYGRLLDEG